MVVVSQPCNASYQKKKQKLNWSHQININMLVYAPFLRYYGCCFMLWHFSMQLNGSFSTFFMVLNLENQITKDNPVVHFLKCRKNSKLKSLSYSEMPPASLLLPSLSNSVKSTQLNHWMDRISGPNSTQLNDNDKVWSYI